MKYDIAFNRARKVWTVWKITGTNAETVKSFKTEQAAKNWIARQGLMPLLQIKKGGQKHEKHYHGL